MMTTADFLLLMIAPAGAVIIGGLLVYISYRDRKNRAAKPTTLRSPAVIATSGVVGFQSNPQISGMAVASDNYAEKRLSA